jgi:hypothetical protein
MISCLRVSGFPPFRQKKIEKMGHGRWYINKQSKIWSQGSISGIAGLDGAERGPDITSSEFNYSLQSSI